MVSKLLGMSTLCFSPIQKVKIKFTGWILRQGTKSRYHIVKTDGKSFYRFHFITFLVGTISWSDRGFWSFIAVFFPKSDNT